MKTSRSSNNTMRQIGICIFLFISNILNSQEILDGYLQTAAENNPGLKASFNEYMAALEVAPQVSTLPDPNVAFAYFIQPVETREGPQQFRISANQMFPWFGTLGAKENAAMQKAKAKYELFREEKSKLFNEVRSLYFNIYFNKKAMDIVNENIDILNAIRDLILVKLETGLVTSLDEYRLKMELNDLENQLKLLKDKHQVLTVMFGNLLNTDMESQVEVPESLWETGMEMDKSAINDSIVKQNHQLKSIDFKLRSLNYQNELARKEGMPDFNLGMNYTIIGEGSNNLPGKDAFMFPNLGVSIPLYREKYKAKVREIIHLETAKENQRVDKENNLEDLFEENWKDLQDADRRIALYKDQQILANQSLDLLRTRYETNDAEFEEYLRMQRKLLQYDLGLEKARSDKQAAISFMQYLMGR